MVILMLLPLILLIIGAMFATKLFRKIQFPFLSSNLVMYGFITVYILMAVASGVYIYYFSQSSPSFISEEKKNELLSVNDAIYSALSTGSLDEIDDKYIDEQQTFTIESGELYLKYDFPEDVDIFIKRTDDASKDVKITTFKSTFMINSVDVSAYKPALHIVQTFNDEIIFNVDQSLVKVATVTGKIDLNDIDNLGSSGYWSAGAQHMIAIEIPKTVKLLNDEEQFTIID